MIKFKYMKMFKFGRNWKNYVINKVDEYIINEAKDSMLKYLPEGITSEEFYKNKTFIDVGCGSGLFSLSAILLGCKKVISFDIQDESIEATNILKNKFKHLINKNTEWQIFKGDILDMKLIEKLKNKADILYSWGVLHHTGDMWKAILNACNIVKPNGYFILAIYNKAESSSSWLKIKKFYNEHQYLQPIINILYGSIVCLAYIIKRKTLNLYRERGMHIYYDAIDWIGGYPYEFASWKEVVTFMSNNGFSLVKTIRRLPTNDSQDKKINFFNKISHKNTGNNEFLFLKNSQ